jgi:hypothetical protein
VRVLCPRAGNMPVMKLDRLGLQIGLWHSACVKATPSATNASIVGVATCGLPSAPIVSNRCWSVQYQRMLGRSFKML